MVRWSGGTELQAEDDAIRKLQRGMDVLRCVFGLVFLGLAAGYVNHLLIPGGIDRTAEVEAEARLWHGIFVAVFGLACLVSAFAFVRLRRHARRSGKRLVQYPRAVVIAVGVFVYSICAGLYNAVSLVLINMV